jgi:hypothetical protein
MPDERLRVDFDEEISIESGESVSLKASMTTVARTDVEAFSMRINTPTDVSCSDDVGGGLVAVLPDGGTAFPYSSGKTAILGGSVEDGFTNYPNPFAASIERTRITFFMSDAGAVSLRIYTVMGRLVKTLIDNESRSAGLHQDVYWDGRNGIGEPVLNGVYYLVLETRINGGELTYRRKVSVVR